MKQLPKTLQRLALQTLAGFGLTAVLTVTGAGMSATRADDQAPEAGNGNSKAAESGKAKHKAKAKRAKAEKEAPPSAAEAKPAAPIVAQPPAPPPEPPFCKLNEPEQPRGGRIDVLGERFGSAPVVRIAGRPARILLRKQDRISVQIPADSDGGEITLLNEGKVENCGTLVIIGKNRE